MTNAKQETLKMRKEKRADFFYALSKYIFVGDVVGGFSPVVLDLTKEINWYAVVVGFIVTAILAYTGDQILKD